MTKVMVDLYSSKEEPLPFHSSTSTKLFAEELIRSAKTSRKNVTYSSSSKYRNVFESMTYAMTYCGKGAKGVDLLYTIWYSPSISIQDLLKPLSGSG